MSLLDYQHPDITFRELPVELGNDRHGNPIFRTNRRSGNVFVVFARWKHSNAIGIAGGWTWICNCGYFPGPHDAPPIPEQRCHGCGNLLAEWVGREARAATSGVNEGGDANCLVTAPNADKLSAPEVLWPTSATRRTSHEEGPRISEEHAGVKVGAEEPDQPYAEKPYCGWCAAGRGGIAKGGCHERPTPHHHTYVQGRDRVNEIPSDDCPFAPVVKVGAEEGLREENERLTTALQRIAGDEPGMGVHRPCCSTGQRIARAALAEKGEEPYQGSNFRRVGPITLGCISPDARAALDLSVERYRRHAEQVKATTGHVLSDPVYSFAYWLFRWSGIVTGVDLNAPENPWAPPPAEKPSKEDQ